MKITLYPKYLIRRMFVQGRHDFFKAGYKLLYPEYSRHGMSPWQHYVIDGKRKGFDNGNHPSDAVFLREGYEIEYPDVKAAGVDPWRHYAEKGFYEGRDNGLHPDEALFYGAGYLEMYPDVAKSGMDPWHHYVLHGKKEGRDNGHHPKEAQFFGAGYLEMYPDVAKSGMDPWHHYVLHGKKEGRDNGHHPKEAQFLGAGYLEMYPDVAKSGMDPWRHYVLHGKKEGRDNGHHPKEAQFLGAGYLEMYPDVAKSGMDPWRHYVLHGKKEGRDNGHHPKEAQFLGAGYLEMYPDVAKSGMDPWRHYVLHGKKEGRDNGHHPKEAQFFGAGYLEMYPDVAKSGMDPWRHYVLHGKKEGRDNGHHPKEAQFFGAGYLEMYPDVAKSGMDPWRHYVLHGKKEGRDNGHHPKEALFLGAGYLEMYPDVAKSGMDPWRHYVLHGKKEGRDNGHHPKEAQFLGAGYLEMYPDVAKSGMDPWRHYVLHGKKEGRDNGHHPKEAQFLGAGYLEMYPDVAKSGMDPWRHYVLHGKKEGRDNGHHPKEAQFFGAGYLEMYPDVAKSGMDPWRHYVQYGKKEGRDTGYCPKDNVFCAIGYLRLYPDVAKLNIDPWLHYVRYGKIEGRQKITTPYKYVKAYKKLWYLDKKAIDDKLKKFVGEGISDNQTQIIVSLTSFPARIEEVKYTIYSLLNQSFKPNKVVLWLAVEEFPHKEKDLPADLLKLRQNGLSIEWCNDIKSYKKLIPAIKKYKNSIIVTADDDIYYQDDWLKKLYVDHMIYPRDIIAHRCHYISVKNEIPISYSKWSKSVISSQASFRLFITGCGGVLYPPNCLYSDVTDDKIFMRLCPTTDDIWFWGMAVLNNRKLRCVKNPENNIIYVNLDKELNHEFTLGSVNLVQGGNDKQLAALLDNYPGLYKKLNCEKDIKVSIIIPVWNAEKYISKCLDSLINQTLKDIEIICVNDGSTDNSLNVLKEYSRKDPRIKIINQQNQGQSVARNNAMDVAQGEFIGFCDNDDWVSKNYFEDLYKSAIDNKADIAATPNVFYVDPVTNKITKKNTGIESREQFISDRGKVVITTGLQWNKIYKADFLKRNNIRCTTIRVAAEDNYFTVQAMMYCHKISVETKAEYYFYRRTNATSNLTKTKKDFCVVDLYKSIDKLIQESSLDENDKESWLNVLKKRKTGDLSLFYNEMEVIYKDDFKKYVAKEFPDIELKLRR